GRPVRRDPPGAQWRGAPARGGHAWLPARDRAQGQRPAWRREVQGPGSDRGRAPGRRAGTRLSAAAPQGRPGAEACGAAGTAPARTATSSTRPSRTATPRACGVVPVATALETRAALPASEDRKRVV